MQNEEEAPCYTYTRVDEPVGLAWFFPDYRYRVDGADARAGDQFIADFASFLEGNSSVLTEERSPSREFAAGFAHAVAVIALYFDGLQLQGG